ncbi:MAG TPA: ImcF-related family protein, partial [Myxococcaceae bacterium]|nr:ImcF-related family protein [Myxococcaceae bacterium]
GAISELKPDTKDEAVLFRNLTPLLDETEKLQQYNEHGAPLLSRFGLSRSGALYETAQKAYNKAARRIIIENQFDEIRDRLSSLTPGKRTAAWNPKSEDYARYYSDLKLYLLLTRPDPRDLEAVELQPKLQEREDLREFIVEQIVRRWDGLAGSGSTRISLITVKRHAQVFAKLLGDNPDQAAFERDPDLVLHARRALNGVRRSDIELANRLLRVQEQNQGQGLSLGQLMGGVPGISAARTIHPAFTRPLWEQQMRYFVDNQFKIVEQWVLTPDTTQDADALTAEIRTKYYQAYVNEWSSFLYSITVVPPQNEEETLRMLQGIINARPFDRLFAKVSDHVHLERKPKAVGMVQKVLSAKDTVQEESTSGESLSPRNVQGHFASLLSFVTGKEETEDRQERNGVLDLYYEQLRLVLAALEDESMKPQAKAEIVLKAKREVEAHLSGAGAWKPLLKQLLIPPLLLVGENITRDVAKRKDTAWCTNVVDRFKLMVEHRYPFCRNCEDASIAELGDMLKPGEGELWRFVKESLGEIVTLSEGQWTFTAEARAHYNPQMLVFLNKAQLLSDALFPNGPTESPKVRFKALFLDPDGDVSNLQRVVFSVDGESMKYDTGGGRERDFTWPGSYEKSGAAIEASSLNGDKESKTHKTGTWGLFRMIEEHMHPERSENRRSFTTTWATDFGVIVRMRITPDYTIKNPFFGASSTFLQVFRDPALKPPPGIALQGSGCAVANNNPSTVQ